MIIVLSRYVCDFCFDAVVKAMAEVHIPLLEQQHPGVKIEVNYSWSAKEHPHEN